MEYLIKGKFEYTATSFRDGQSIDRQEIGCISELVNADSLQQAEECAEQLFARYEAKGRTVFDRSVAESKPIRANYETDSIPNVEKRAEPLEAARPVVHMRCKKCGITGVRGGYPFSTFPESAQICDDCGA